MYSKALNSSYLKTGPQIHTQIPRQTWTCRPRVVWASRFEPGTSERRAESRHQRAAISLQSPAQRSCRQPNLSSVSQTVEKAGGFSFRPIMPRFLSRKNLPASDRAAVLVEEGSLCIQSRHDSCGGRISCRPIAPSLLWRKDLFCSPIARVYHGGSLFFRSRRNLIHLVQGGRARLLPPRFPSLYGFGAQSALIAVSLAKTGAKAVDWTRGS